MAKSFADILASLAPVAKIEQPKTTGTVVAYTDEQAFEVAPELVRGMLQHDGSPWVDKRGQAPLIIRDWCREENKGMTVVVRHVQLTPGLAKWFLTKFKSHNRTSKKPAIDRYSKDMLLGNWPFVGNTWCFVVDEVGSMFPVGDCNGRHTSEAIVKSKTPVDMLLVVGILEKNANCADVSQPRSAADVIDRLHRFDRYLGKGEIDGKALGIDINAASVKTLNNMHSRALRILACVKAGKDIKDSEALPPSAVMALDREYGDIVEQCCIRTFMLNSVSSRVDAVKNKVVKGALATHLSLHHVASMMVLASATKDDEGKIVLDDEVLGLFGQFLVEVYNEIDIDSRKPGVALRQAMLHFKLNKVSSKTIHWNAFKLAVMAAISEASGETETGSLTIDMLTKVSKNDRCYFNTLLDQQPEEEEEETTGNDDDNDDNDDEMEEIDE